MRWASSISTEAQLDAAIAECSDALEAALDGAAPDLVGAFVSPHFSESWTRLPSTLARRFPRAVPFGCSGDGVLADGREIEGERALAMVAAALPGVRLTPLVVRPGDFVDLESVCPRIPRSRASKRRGRPRPAGGPRPARRTSSCSPIPSRARPAR
jgi:small ligand-binding sensory domain FIST